MAVVGVTVSEPTNADLKALFERHMAVSDERHRETTSRMVARDAQDAEFRGQVKTSLHTLQEEQTAQRHRLAAVEERAERAEKTARKSMASHDDLHRFVHDTWNEHHEQVVDILKAQNREFERAEHERERAEREKLEQAKRESIAAKAVSDRREQRLRLFIGLVPLGCALIAAIATYLAAHAAHSDTDAKLQHIEHVVETISQH